MTIAQYDSHVVHMVEYRLDIDQKGAKLRGLLLVWFWNSTFLSLIMLLIPRMRNSLEYMRMRAHLILAHLSQTGLLTCQVRWSKVGQKIRPIWPHGLMSGLAIRDSTKPRVWRGTSMQRPSPILYNLVCLNRDLVPIYYLVYLNKC
jgi:hypothetical protein